VYRARKEVFKYLRRFTQEKKSPKLKMPSFMDLLPSRSSKKVSGPHGSIRDETTKDPRVPSGPTVWSPLWLHPCRMLHQDIDCPGVAAHDGGGRFR
jgi:hypothetical protein